MANICAVIAAAGRGSRAGLPYPKTLYAIQGVPILLRIAKLLIPYDNTPTIVASPAGEPLIRACMQEANASAHVVVQPTPAGMGDAVLCIRQSAGFERAEHILLIWGDIPFVQAQTLALLVEAHLQNQNDFTFVTRHVDSAYTTVLRDQSGDVVSVLETRETGIDKPQAGERDIGVFIFRKELVLDYLQRDFPNKWGKTTGEHGFLYIIGALVSDGYRVEALPIATELDLVSLNHLDDVKAYLYAKDESTCVVL
jgi:bifunctional UDP-N-acetylglucosamine pyrophosphorylase/glucosamine-1-phosphate N-acetyltransferase